MKRLSYFSLVALGAAALAGLQASEARADATLLSSAGNVQIGVNDAGQLYVPNALGIPVENSSRIGVAIDLSGSTAGPFGWNDSTSPGCLCEGWGVSASGTSLYANNSLGTANVTGDSFVATATSITSAVSATSLPGLKVTQVYSEAPETSSLFQNVVTITNDTGGDLTDVRYVRVLYWDIPTTEFSESVTIGGTATTALLEYSRDDGFATADPLAADPGPITACAVATGEFTDCDSGDHGAYFRFNFGDLAAGESREFTIYYGGTLSESAANAALAAVGAELFSYGQTDPGDAFGNPTDGTPGTYIFAFKGVGGDPVFPAPEPATLAMFGFGLAGIGLLNRRRRKS